MARRRRRGRRRNKTSWFSGLSKGKKIAVCAGGVVLCLLAAGIIYVAVLLGKLDTEDIAAEDIIVNQEAELSGEGYTNVALFGVDSRSGQMDKGTRSDCIIVASLNNETKEVRMISVYRDTLLDIEDDYLQKCNAAYAFGGPTQAINMLNKNLDLNIQDFATVDFGAIAGAIDMLGGIEIDITEAEVKPLNKYVSETAKAAGKKAHKISGPGLQKLDGVQATTYARIRSTAGGDFTRTERQRLVIEKIVEKAQQSDLATINKIIDELFPTIKTSFSSAEILSYAKDFMKYKIGESSGFPFDKTTDTISGLGSIVIPVTLADNVKQLHEFFYDSTDYTPSSQVNTISNKIVARVGQRSAMEDTVLNSQTYTDTEEDKAQENNQYAPPPENDNNNTGNSNDSGNNTGNSGSSNTGGNTGNTGNNGTSGGGNTNTGGNTSSGNTGSNDNTGGNGNAGGGTTPAPETPPADEGNTESGGNTPAPETPPAGEEVTE